jgi:hypothetical protein
MIAFFGEGNPDLFGEVNLRVIGASIIVGILR